MDAMQRRGPPMNFTFHPLDHPDAEVTRAYFCQLTGRSRITAYRLERSDPQWPKPVLRGSASSTRLPIASAICCRYGRETERRDAVELMSSAMLIGGHKMAPDRLVIDLDQRARIGGRKLPSDDRSARSKDAMTAALGGSIWTRIP